MPYNLTASARSAPSSNESSAWREPDLGSFVTKYQLVRPGSFSGLVVATTIRRRLPDRYGRKLRSAAYQVSS
ncbi:MAG: hypothetical protein ACYC3V_06385 [Chloroflexota bacterium]